MQDAHYWAMEFWNGLSVLDLIGGSVLGTVVGLALGVAVWVLCWRAAVALRGDGAGITG